MRLAHFRIWTAAAIFLGGMSHGSMVTDARDHAAVQASPVTAGGPIIGPDDPFFTQHPEFQDETEVVNEAARQIAAEGFAPRDWSEASVAVAARSRELLDQRTPLEWQHQAVRLFPALGVAGSPFNSLFLQHYRELQRSSPNFTEEPSWPVLLAKRCAAELRPPLPAPQVPVAAPVPVRPDRVQPPKTPTRSESVVRHPVSTALAMFLLVAAIISPAVYLFRKAGFAGEPSKESAAEPEQKRLWRTSLKHTIFVYVAMALVAAFHSLLLNADLGFADRLVVSLLVGALFGIFISLPFCALDALWQSLHLRWPGPLRH